MSTRIVQVKIVNDKRYGRHFFVYPNTNGFYCHEGTFNEGTLYYEVIKRAIKEAFGTIVKDSWIHDKPNYSVVIYNVKIEDSEN